MKKIVLIFFVALIFLFCSALQADEVVYWNATRSQIGYPSSITLGDNQNVQKVNIYVDPITGKEFSSEGGVMPPGNWEFLTADKPGLVIVTACPTSPRPGLRLREWIEQISFKSGSWVWYFKRYQYTTNLVGAWSQIPEYNSWQPIYWTYYYCKLVDKSNGPRFFLAEPYQINYDSAADVDKNGTINTLDADIVRAGLGEKVQEGDPRDINNNYFVDEDDLGIVNKLRGTRPTLDPATIMLPLPSGSYVEAPAQSPKSQSVEVREKITTTWGKVKEER